MPPSVLKDEAKRDPSSSSSKKLPFDIMDRYKWRKICIKSILCLVGHLIWKQIISIFLVSYFESFLERPISSDYLSFVI